MKRRLVLIVAGIAFYLGCTNMAPEVFPENEQQLNCTPQFPGKNVTYTNYVEGIIARHCTESCHRGGNTPGLGNFTTYNGLRPHTGSIFYYRVIQDHADMPQGDAPLPKSIRDSLNIWIENCSPEN